jgi:uncharacterized cupredoxin-like copper-binding protein
MSALHLRRALIVPVVATVGLAACGGGDGGDGDGGDTQQGTAQGTAVAAGAGTTDRLSAAPDGSFAFDTKALSAKAGRVTLRMANPSSSGQPHGIAIDGSGVDADGKVVDPGSTSTVTATLKPGKYTFYCPVPGHRQAGMQGTLTVR